MFLEVRNAVKTIDNINVLDGINLSFERGNIYGIHGKNGSGKTMFMKAVCGLIRLSEGEICIGGRVLGKNQEFPSDVGALIETPGFIGNYSGLKNLKLLADIKKKITEREICDYMRELELNPDDNKKVKKYSLGMRQKLGVIAAIMETPELIILDEPTNALDAKSVEKVNELLLKKKEEGCLILISSHDFNELEEITDEIIHFENGRIV